MSSLLTKSKYLAGLQCLKYLWLLVNDPDRVPQPDAVTQHVFDQGQIVNDLAKKLFPNGIDIATEDFMDNIRQTKQFLPKRMPLFEAGILTDNVFSRIDILNPVNKDEWDIIEVKSSTSVKDINIHDVSFQKYCCEKQGLNIRKCFLAFINNQYIKSGDIVPQKLFIIQDISVEVATVFGGVADRIKAMLEAIQAPGCPQAKIGLHCREPYTCPITDCWSFLPDHNVFTLYYGGKKSFDLFQNGVLSIKEIPISCELNNKQLIQKTCEINGKPYIEREGIRQFLSDLKYPLYYFDFETISPALPLFDGTRPYQNIPFQFSVHLQETEKEKLRHFSFLADGQQDPRPALLTKLHETIGNIGSIIVYNQSFEKAVLKDLGTAFPKYRQWTEDIVDRLVDLLLPFRSFYYYNPLQNGSISIKNVLPALTGKSYEGMEISKGDVASVAFMDITYGNVPEEVKHRVRKELERYCSLDTEALALIVNELEQIVKS